MSCCDIENCNLLSHCVASLSAANAASNGGQEDTNVEVEFESASSEHLHLIVKFLNNWKQRRCLCLIRRSGHHSLIAILLMLTTKSLVEEIEKLCAIFLSLADGVQTPASSFVAAASDDTTGGGTGAGQSSNSSESTSQRITERREETSCDDLTAKVVSRPSSPLVTEEVEDLLRAVEVIFNQEFLLSNHYLNNKTNILSRVLKNLLFKQRFMTSVTECLKSATPKFLPLSFVHLIIKLTSSVLRCVSQETVKSSDEFRFVSISQRAEVRSAIVHYMQQLSEDDLRNPKARQAVEFCWDRIQELSLDTIDSDCLDLALKYIKSSTLTMRLSGLAFINQQVGICERKQPRGHAVGGTLSPHSQQRLVASKLTFKRWLRNQQMVSVLFGASTHVELVRQCHAILQFMASGQLLTESDIDALWAAVNDKYKNREVIAAIEGILHHLNEDLLERFKEHLRDQSIHNHSEQTISLSCHITKVSWRRQLMTLNLAHQFGSILASKRNKSVSTVAPNAPAVSHVVGGGSSAGLSSDSGQQGSSTGNVGGPNSSAFKQFKTIKDPSHRAVAVENMSNSDSEPQYPQNAVVKPDMDSPVLLSPKGAARRVGAAKKMVDAEFAVPAEWKSGEDDVKGASSKDEDSGAGGSKQSNQSPPQLKPVQHKLRKKKQTTSAADFITGSSSEEEQVLLKFPNTGDRKDNPSKLVAPKRRRLDRKCVKHVDTAIPPPPPPPPPLPINVNTIQHSPVLANAKEYMAHGIQVMDPCSGNMDKESRMRTNIEKLEKIVADASLDIFCEENQENVLQETDDLFRGIRDSKNDFGLDTQLQVDVNTGMVKNPMDGNGNRMPLLAAENVETGSQFSATGRRNSEPEDLPDPDGGNSTQDDIGIEDEDVEEEDDDDDVEDLDDVDDDDDMSASAGLYCDQMIIRQLLQHEKILKPVTFRPAGVQTSVHQPPTLSVGTSADATAGSASNRETQSETSAQKGAALAAVLKSASGKGRRNSSKGQTSGSSSKSQRMNSDVPNDNDEENLEVQVITDGDGEYGDGGDTTDSAESSSSSQSSTNSLSSTSIFIKRGNSLIWDLLTSGQLSQLSPEQQECVKQNLFDLVAVFLKYPEILKEMVQSLLNSIYQHCSTITCVKMLQALFSNVMSLSSYAIQTHAMLDILVRNLVNLVQTNSSAGGPMLIMDDHSEEGVHEINSVVGLMPSLSQAELGEFLHLFESIFHKTNHGVCYTFSDEHVITLWSILSNNSHYKDFFLNWLCGICQTEEIHIMTEQQWLMIYCKLVLNDKQWAKIHGHNVSGYLSVSTESFTEVVSPLQQTSMARELEVFTSALQTTSPTLSDLSEVHLLAVLFCKAVKGTFFEEQQPTPSADSRNSCDTINTETDSMAEANSFNTDLPTNILPTELANELINDGLRQFWKILLTSNDSDMQKMSRDVLNGYYLHLPELSKEHEFIKATSERITKFLKTTDTEKLLKLRELQSIVCLLLHHIQQSYKKYAFHIRLSALKQGSAPIHSHSKTWMPRKGAHQLKLYLARRTGMSQSKVVTMQSSDYLGELRAEVAFHQMEEVFKSNASASDMTAIEAADALDSCKLKYHRMLTNGLELKLEHDDRTLSDLCVRDESQIATVLTFLQCEDVNSDSSSKFQLGDVFLKFPGCLYVEPPLENYPQVILLQEAHFNQLFHLLRCLSNLKSVANKAQIFNVDEIIRLVWDLIMLLPTYPPIQEQFEILSTEKEFPTATTRGDISDPSIDWSAVLDVDNVFKLLYSLQMLEHLATNCHNKSSQIAGTDSALTPRGFGGHGANLLTPTVTTVTSFEPLCNSEASESPSAATPNASSSDWCKKFVEYGGLKFLINVFESKILLHDSSCSTVQWSEWKQECLASILRLFYIFSTHPYTSGGLTLRSQPSFVGDSLSVSQSEIFIAPVESRGGNGKASGDGSFISMLDQQIFLDSLLTIMNSASKAQTDSISRRTLSLKSNLVCQCFRILNLCACHDASVCTIFMNHTMFSSLIYQLVVNFATKNISKTASSGLAKLAQKSFEFCKKTIQQLIEFLSEVKSISESNFEECGNRDSRDSSVVADASCGQEYFALFENLMRIYLEKEEERVDDEEFVLYLVQSVRVALNEFFDNSFWTEENGECSSLRGLLTIMCAICRLKPPFVTSDQGLELIMTLIECLFRIENETKTPRFVNPDTRKAAFDLIIQLASGSVSNYNFIYDTLMQQNSKESHAPYPWSYWPLDERRSDAGFVGLINLGATCYMATALQHLFMIHEARSAILCAGQIVSEKGANKTGQGSKQDTMDGVNAGSSNAQNNPERKHQKILLELQKMFAYLQLSDRKAYNPRSFCRSYVMDNEPLNTCDQKDMTEFFNDLIGKLEDMSPKLRDLVHNLFRGEITNSVVSLDCNHVSKTVEEFYTVRCQVADLRDLYESFDEFCQIDMLEGDNMYTCSSCQTKVRAEKRASFKKLPRILVINTMRYKFNMESMAREKVNTHFSFPTHLNMGKYTETYLVGDSSRCNISAASGSAAAAASSSVDCSQQEELNYELIGVTVHTGAAESGHYYCFIRDRSYPQSDVWFLFNDSEVKPFNPDNIPQECFGGQMVSKTFNQLTEKFVDYAFEKSHSAYMLFYERSVDLMRGEDKTSLLQSNLNPPKLFSDAINADNLQLRHDRTLFDKNYFELLYKFNDVVAKTLPTPGDSKSAVHFDLQRAKLSTTFVLETLVHSRESPSINFWLDFLSSLYSDCVEVCKWLIRHLAHNDWWLNQVLVRCSSAHIRALFQKLIFLAISTVCNKTSEEEWQLFCKNDFRQFVKTYINFTNSSILKRRHLKHFFEYCSLLMDIAKMGKQEALILISVGTIGHIVKFFLDVKLQKNQPVNANGTSDDEELENGNGENDIISSAALEFDALNELLSFTTDGKKKSAVFHNIVELLEILLDKACSSSGASTMRDFQSLTRCLTDVDHTALTSNSFEFLKVLIEEEINLDSVSSILQMLIRMNKSFENFIPVRFCELILAAGSPEIVKPYFRVLAKLETQLHPLSVTQHIIKYIPKLLQWCPRPTLGLLKDCARSVHVTTWALQNLDIWVKQFLIAENNYRVRFEAAEILMMLVPDNAQLYNYWKSYVDKFNVPEKHSFDHDEATLAVIHKILKHLLNMLEEFPSLTMGTYRFQYYFTVMTALNVSVVEKKMFTPYFPQLWAVFYPHLIHSKVESCVNKQALLLFWYWVCVDCPQNVNIIVANKAVLKNIFFNYILVNHEDRDLIAFNKQCLQTFFGLIRLCCESSVSFCLHFMRHENFQWALENVFPSYTLYPKASNELLKIMEILLSYLDASMNSDALGTSSTLRSVAGFGNSNSSCSSDLTSDDKEEVAAFKKKLIFQFTKCLNRRGLWISVSRIYSVLLQREEDYVCFVCEAPGLRLLTEALLASFEAPHHVPIFHNSAVSNAAMSANAASVGGINARADLVNLLTKVIRNYRQYLETSASATGSGPCSSSASSSHTLEKMASKPQWKNCSHVCEKLLSLLNATHSLERRSESIACLREIIPTFPAEAAVAIVEVMHAAHSSCERKKCSSTPPGIFFPRAMSSKQQGGSVGSETGRGGNGNPMSGGILGFAAAGNSGPATCAVRKYELAMCLHPEHLTSDWNVDKSYEEELRAYYSPYYNNVAQPVLNISIQRGNITPKLAELICYLTLDTVRLRLDWMARLLMEYYNKQELTTLLCNSNLFAQVFGHILSENRTALNIMIVFSFCTSYTPKLKELTLEQKNTHLHAVVSFFISQSYHLKVGHDSTNSTNSSPNIAKQSQPLLVPLSESSEASSSPSNAKPQIKPISNTPHTPESITQEINGNLKAMQLLFTCCNAGANIDISTLKNSLNVLHAKLLSVKCATDVRKDMSSSDCNLPPKKMKLGPSESSSMVSDMRSKMSKDGLECSSSAALQSDNQQERMMIEPMVITTSVNMSGDLKTSGTGGSLTPLPGSSSIGVVSGASVKAQPVYSAALLKTLSSTLVYLKQYEERCNIQN